MTMSLLWILAQASLLVFGIWWCVEMMPRWRRDLETLQDGDPSDRLVVLILWLVTAVIVALGVTFCLRVFRRVLDALGEFG